jgi:nicotinamide mononucleotide (NMN) deamidase PncC
MPEFQSLVQKIHDASGRLVLAVTGGGSRAITELLEVPGASRTVLEAVVPYGQRAMIDWLGGRPDQACSAPTARAMAMAAFLRARRLEDEAAADRVLGVACTASLASDRPKRGPHRAHVAIQTADRTAAWSLRLLKDRRTREEEERLVASFVLGAVAEACGVDPRPPIGLLKGEQIEGSSIDAPPPWRELLLGRREAVCHGASGEAGPPGAVFPGAFNPLHAGHRRMLETARHLLGRPVEPEISILNVDKPPLDYVEMSRRVEQFGGLPVWLTRAATFDAKSALFPGAVLVVGVDTLRRIADPRYYAGDPEACRTAINRIVGRGCRFLVFGRAEKGRFVTVDDLDLPETLRSICTGVSPERFREDVSSTEIRRKNTGG